MDILRSIIFVVLGVALLYSASAEKLVRSFFNLLLGMIKLLLKTPMLLVRLIFAAVGCLLIFRGVAYLLY